MNGDKVPASSQAPAAPGPAPTYSVRVIDNYSVPDPDAAHSIHGFSTWEAAVEYARRRTWDSVEEFRRPGSDVRAEFLLFGESCSAYGAFGEGKSYRGRDELDYFLTHPATDEQRNWSVLTPGPMGERQLEVAQTSAIGPRPPGVAGPGEPHPPSPNAAPARAASIGQPDFESPMALALTPDEILNLVSDKAFRTAMTTYTSLVHPERVKSQRVTRSPRSGYESRLTEEEWHDVRSSTTYRRVSVELQAGPDIFLVEWEPDAQNDGAEMLHIAECSEDVFIFFSALIGVSVGRGSPIKPPESSWRRGSLRTGTGSASACGAVRVEQKARPARIATPEVECRTPQSMISPERDFVAFCYRVMDQDPAAIAESASSEIWFAREVHRETTRETDFRRGSRGRAYCEQLQRLIWMLMNGRVPDNVTAKFRKDVGPLVKRVLERWEVGRLREDLGPASDAN